MEITVSAFLQRNGSWLGPLIVAASAMFGAYMHNDKTLTERVKAVEVQQANDASGIARVEGKVDRVDGRVNDIYNKLLDWEKH